MFDSANSVAAFTDPDVSIEVAGWSPRTRQHATRCVELAISNDYSALARHIYGMPSGWYCGARLTAINTAIRMELITKDPEPAIARLAKAIRGYKDGEDLARITTRNEFQRTPSAYDFLNLWRA